MSQKQAKQDNRPKRVCNCVWAVRQIGKYPQVHVQFLPPDGNMLITRYEKTGIQPDVVILPRGEARILARRINQALDKWSGNDTSWR